MDQPPPRQAGPAAMRVLGLAAAFVVVALVAIAAWRWQLQRVNLVLVNQSGVEARLAWQPQVFAALETVTIAGCASMSIDLGGGQSWRLEANGLDINANAVDRPWLTPRIAFEIWLDAGGSSRINGPYAIDLVVSAPVPSGCP